MSTPPTNGPEPTPHDEFATELSTDELAVHAVLDGEATADQRDRVATRPDLVARLEEFRALRARLTAPPPGPDPLLADAHVIRALAAMRGSDVPDGPAGSDETLGSTPRRNHRRPTTQASRRRATTWLVAAAVVVVVALGALTASNLVGQRSDDVASVASDAQSLADAPASDGAEESAGPTTTGPSSAASESRRTTDPVLRELGPVADLGELIDASRDALEIPDLTADASTRGEAFATPIPLPCAAELTATTGAVLLMANGVLDGRDVVVRVTSTGESDDKTIQVLTTDDCALVFVGPL